MINFRFHIVSLVAVFLALGIGVIVGSAVIDSAVVDQLRGQQSRLRTQINRVEAENGQLRADAKAQTAIDAALAHEGSERLLEHELQGVPVLVVATEGTDRDVVTGLVTQLSTANAAYRGTVWLTDRFGLDGDGEVKDLAAVLGTPAEGDATALRANAVSAMAAAFRPRSPDAGDDPAAGPSLLGALLARGFLDVSAPPGQDDKVVPAAPAGTRLVVVSSPAAAVADDALALPLARGLVADRAGRFVASVVAAAVPTADPPASASTAGPGMVDGLRDDDVASRRLSTVDDLGQYAGRLATVLALSDLGRGRVGHFGHGRGAQRLLPARPPTP